MSSRPSPLLSKYVKSISTLFSSGRTTPSLPTERTN